MKLIKLSAIDSTNTYLKDGLQSKVFPDETVVWTNEQTHGRGQRDSRWTSKPSESLTFSVLKRFRNMEPSRHMQINFAVSLSISEVLKHHKVPGLSVKWPNDIMSYQKKLCGVLIENQLSATRIATSVIGVGLNVNQLEFTGLPNAGSLLQVTGNNFELRPLLEQLCTSIFAKLNQLDTNQPVDFKPAYEALLFRKGIITVFENSSGEQFNGIILGISDEGKLRVELEDERIASFGLKEIQMRY